MRATTTRPSTMRKAVFTLSRFFLGSLASSPCTGSSWVRDPSVRPRSAKSEFILSFLRNSLSRACRRTDGSERSGAPVVGEFGEQAGELRALLVREGGERPGERLAPLPPHSAEQTRTFGSERDPCASSIVGIGLPPNPA